MKANKIFLADSELQFIRDHILDPLKVFHINMFIFGSRAKGTHSKFSDVDLLIKADKYSGELIKKISEINEFLIGSNFPYKVDIVLDCDIAESYREDIYQFKVEFK